eukprot:811765-Rhodomonas_salina.3
MQIPRARMQGRARRAGGAKAKLEAWSSALSRQRCARTQTAADKLRIFQARSSALAYPGTCPLGPRMPLYLSSARFQ